MVKSNEKAIKMQKNRDYWLERWKAGAFEMDAATMASLAEQEADSLGSQVFWPPKCTSNLEDC
jgi:hypothetical protein